MKIFLCGDVMTGRGIDQILRQPDPPRIHESYVQDAREYVTLAEQVNGPIPRQVSPEYIWGEALDELNESRPDARIINLETAVTRSEKWDHKGINYRMHPANIDCITAAKIDCCVLSNNHVLDWGREGLFESLATLQSAGLRIAGAGLSRGEAQSPAVIPVPGQGRILVFGVGAFDSGVPQSWSATDRQAGVNFLSGYSDGACRKLRDVIASHKRPGDVILLSIHWGGNWGYDIDPCHRELAHRLVEEGGVDLIHGHSSHHPKGIEVYRDKLILYGCGDFINDYEGISGYEEFRSDLRLMYFPELDAETGKLRSLGIVPLRTRRLRLEAASDEEAAWLQGELNRESETLGTDLQRYWAWKSGCRKSLQASGRSSSG